MNKFTDNGELTGVQERLLRMLQFIHKVCVDNNLRYYMVGGTMLGAVRHKGFIPWDDDIDVGFPRSDYEEFISITKKMNDNDYCVEVFNNNNPDFQYPYAKLYDKNTTLIENTRYRIKRGIYIDIFPLDGLKGSNFEEAKASFKKIYKKIIFNSMVSCEIRKSRSKYKNLSIYFGRIVCPFFIKQSKILNDIDKLSKKTDFDSAEMVANVVGNWGYKEIMPKSYFGTPKEYEFCGITAFGVEKPDEYLRALYGNYMQLPPKEKQVSHHDYIKCDLDESYLK